MAPVVLRDLEMSLLAPDANLEVCILNTFSRRVCHSGIKECRTSHLYLTKSAPSARAGDWATSPFFLHRQIFHLWLKSSTQPTGADYVSILLESQTVILSSLHDSSQQRYLTSFPRCCSCPPHLISISGEATSNKWIQFDS